MGAVARSAENIYRVFVRLTSDYSMTTEKTCNFFVSGYSNNGVEIPQPSSGGGGAGFNPNIYNQFLGNQIREGNTIVDYEGLYDDTSGRTIHRTSL